MTREEAIAQAKAAETKETAALVVADRELQRILACWPHVPRREGEAFPCFAPEEAPKWEGLWEGVQVDEGALVELSGLPSGRALVAYRRARGLRLIYPDGSIHEVGKWVLQKLIKDAGRG